MNICPIYYLIGILLSGLGGLFIIPAALEAFVYDSPHWQPFALSCFSCVTVGGLLALAHHSSQKIDLKLREAFLLTAASWVTLSFFACLPFYWSDQFPHFIDAWFEAVSALTTTGTTVIENLEGTTKGILLWRSMLQWLGGTGIIVMAMTILPVLNIGGMQLFRNEFSDKSEKILPRVSQISTAILWIYMTLTVACGIFLFLAGMTGFDAICHALTTVSTGGLSTHDLSIGYFDNIWIDITLMFFMMVGGTTFILFIKAWQGHGIPLIRDPQFRLYLLVTLSMGLVLSVWKWGNGSEPFGDSMRESFFCIVSFITSTGFVRSDYIQWGSFPLIILFLLTLSGGCTGSTSGGIKLFRLHIMFLGAQAHLRHLYRPHGVYIPTYQSNRVSESVSGSVLTFITLYFFSGFCLALALSLTGMDFASSLSGAMAALGNTGPGITESVGPVATYAAFGVSQKIILMVGMMLGRLELLTILVLFMPSFWRS